MTSNIHTDDSFSYLLNLLAKEIDLINNTIDRIDGITQAVKNWAIVTWAGSITVFLGEVDLRPYLLLTMVLPLLFWFSDARWRYLQKRSIVRQQKIAEFLNSEEFKESFETRSLENFYILDLVGKGHQRDADYQKSVNLKKIFFYKELSWFYGGLMLLSLILGSFFLIQFILA